MLASELIEVVNISDGCLGVSTSRFSTLLSMFLFRTCSVILAAFVIVGI